MALKATVDSLDNVEESLRAHYTEKDGVFVLQVEGVREHPEVTNLANAYQAEKAKRQEQGEELKALKAKVAELPEDFSLEAWERAKKGKSNSDELLRLRQSLEAERDEWRTKAEEADRRIYELTVERDLDSYLSSAGVTEPVYLEAARLMLKPEIKVVDGKPMVETDMGPLALSDYVPRWVSGKGQAFVSPPKGAGARGSSGEPVRKPLAEMTEQERVALYQQNPEEFRRLSGLPNG